MFKSLFCCRNEHLLRLSQIAAPGNAKLTKEAGSVCVVAIFCVESMALCSFVHAVNTKQPRDPPELVIQKLTHVRCALPGIQKLLPQAGSVFAIVCHDFEARAPPTQLPLPVLQQRRGHYH